MVCKVFGSAPYLEFASFLRKLFLAATFAMTFCTCCEKGSVRSGATVGDDVDTIAAVDLLVVVL